MKPEDGDRASVQNIGFMPDVVGTYDLIEL
jgi:hypothetical protein